MDIDNEHDLSYIGEDEYHAKIRHASQLATCPCTNCESRCWDTGALNACVPYRKWWYRNQGLKYKQ